MSAYSESALKNLSKDSEVIEAEAFHHFKYCQFCIPGAIDMPEDKRLCSEGLSYLKRRRDSL